MKKFVMGIVIGLLLAGVLPVQAQDRVPPIEVQFIQGKWMTIYDCWPGLTGPQPTVLVYRNLAEGSAPYACKFRLQTEIVPYIPPRADALAYSVGH